MAMGLPVVGKAHEQGGAGAPFHWFVYGSSLDREAFTAWANDHGYRLPDFAAAVPARLPGFRLAFDVTSRFWGGAVASITEETGAHVEGLAVPMPGDARGLVDHKEGAISGLYVPFEAEVVPLAGGAPIRALVYRASPERRLAREAPPSPAFLRVLVKGTKEAGLSEEWAQALERLA